MAVRMRHVGAYRETAKQKSVASSYSSLTFQYMYLTTLTIPELQRKKQNVQIINVANTFIT